MRRFVAYGPSLVVLFTACLTLLAGPEAIRQIQAARSAATVSVARQRLDGDDLLERLNQSVRDIAAAVEPSVVYIRADMPGRRGVSTGSGWVYDELGHIVTNAHVVSGAAEIIVNFHDGRVRTATFVARDNSTDIAVIKVDGDAALLFPARRATDQAVHQGDAVFAFGSPFGFKFSMSQGIVSGLGRDAQTSIGPGGTVYSNFIQTDAAINPGNSGGPLVDVNGQVVGMNTAIIADASPAIPEDGPEGPEEPSWRGQRPRLRELATGSLGIGFAIPLETIESVAAQLIDKGVVIKGYLGVGLDEIDGARAERLGFDRGAGVVIIRVVEGQPASLAGLQRFDIVTHINGRATPNMSVLRSIISNSRPDATIKVSVWREGQTLERDVTLMAAVVNANGEPVPVDHENMLALADQDQSRVSIARALTIFGVLKVEDADQGAAIRSIRLGSLAARFGLAEGDVIVMALDRPVRSTSDLFEALRPAALASSPVEAAIVVRDASGAERPSRLLLEP